MPTGILRSRMSLTKFFTTIVTPGGDTALVGISNTVSPSWGR
jgi:hypothetical protein